MLNMQRNKAQQGDKMKNSYKFLASLSVLLSLSLLVIPVLADTSENYDAGCWAETPYGTDGFDCTINLNTDYFNNHNDHFPTWASIGCYSSDLSHLTEMGVYLDGNSENGVTSASVYRTIKDESHFEADWGYIGSVAPSAPIELQFYEISSNTWTYKYRVNGGSWSSLDNFNYQHFFACDTLYTELENYHYEGNSNDPMTFVEHSNVQYHYSGGYWDTLYFSGVAGLDQQYGTYVYYSDGYQKVYNEDSYLEVYDDSSGRGYVDPSGSIYGVSGNIVTLNAYNNEGQYYWDHWSKNGQFYSSYQSINVPIDGATYIAWFTDGGRRRALSQNTTDLQKPNIGLPDPPFFNPLS
jgi:hypothetical protein